MRPTLFYGQPDRSSAFTDQSRKKAVQRNWLMVGPRNEVIDTLFKTLVICKLPWGAPTV